MNGYQLKIVINQSQTLVVKVLAENDMLLQSFIALIARSPEVVELRQRKTDSEAPLEGFDHILKLPNQE